MEHKNRPAVVAAVCVIGILFLLAILNAGLAVDTVKKFVSDELTFTEAVDEIKSKYTSDQVTWKTRFVDLNGLFARLTGRQVYNKITAGENGMLIEQFRNIDMTAYTSEITEFSQYLDEDLDIPFLYIQAPYKEDFEDKVLPYGTQSYANEVTDTVLSALNSGGVDTMDLRPVLSATPEMLEKNFYRTDHHWNADGAFVAFQLVVQALEERFPDRGIDLTYTQNDQWERHTLNNWFLGSQGKRVGQYYGGTDDLIWYTPRFETEMSCCVMKYSQLYKGDFSDANIREEYIESKDYYGDNAYCVYIGGDYPLVQHRNLKAPSDLKILWLKDSFTLPLQSCLSTVFQEIDVVDPRHFTECSIAEYAGGRGYDIVIACLSPSIFDVRLYRDLDFGIEETRQERLGTIYSSVFRGDAELAAMQGEYHHYGLEVTPGKTYRLTFEDAIFSAGDSECLEVKLYNDTAAATLFAYLFDVEYCSNTGKFEWTFTVPDVGDDTVRLVLYAGKAGETAGIGVCYKNVHLEERIKAADEEMVIYQGDIQMEPREHDYHNYAIDVRANTVYHLDFSNVVCTEGEISGVDVVVYNRTTDSMVRRFTINDASAGADFYFKVPDTGTDKIQLLFYAGVRGATSGNGVIYKNVIVKQMGNAVD
ncbi:MAG: hypothetical protein IKM11_01370 [Oscillospiraceae bacterium]|nr:hypothetical protein [Oscillospiraceae bacterium]